MLSVAAFWILLCVPGYAFLRRFQPGMFEGGVLSAVISGYVATLVLLTPVSIIGYAFRLPIIVLSCTIVVSILCGSAWLVRDLARSRTRLQFSPIAIGCALVIIASSVLSLRVGSLLAGDGKYHTARVRMLLDFGFNNWDPMASGPHFDPVYNTNLYHALMASAAQLTSLHAPDVWTYTLFWARLIVAAAIGHFAFTVLGERWLGWLAAAACTLFIASDNTSAYPNSLAAFAFLPFGLAFTVEAFVGGRGMRPVFGLAAVSAVLVEVHALYLVFLCLIAGPALLIRLVFSLRTLPRRRELVFSILALGLGVPWFAERIWQGVEHALTARAAAQPGTALQPGSASFELKNPAPASSDEDEPEWSYKGFRRLGNARVMLDPSVFLDPGSQETRLVLALIAGAFTRRRTRFAAIALGLGTVMVALLLPPTCTALQHAAGAAWVLHRIVAIFSSAGLALFPGAIVLVLWERVPRPWTRAFGVVVTLGNACIFGAPSTQAFRGFLERAASTNKLQRQLEAHARLHAWFSQKIPRGSIVAVPPLRYADIVIDCDCYPLAMPKNKPSHGVEDIERRRADATMLFTPKSSLHRRLRILRHYGVRQIFLPRKAQVESVTLSYGPAIVKIDELDKNTILTLDANADRLFLEHPDPTPAPTP